VTGGDLLDRPGTLLPIKKRLRRELAQQVLRREFRSHPRNLRHIKADTESPRRDPALQDREQKTSGGKAILSAQIIAEMGFTDVWVIKGGCSGWRAAGYVFRWVPGPWEY